MVLVMTNEDKTIPDISGLTRLNVDNQELHIEC
jgi:hypothetical protein